MGPIDGGNSVASSVIAEKKGCKCQLLADPRGARTEIRGGHAIGREATGRACALTAGRAPSYALKEG
jgi:hypothetical protein